MAFFPFFFFAIVARGGLPGGLAMLPGGAVSPQRHDSTAGVGTGTKTRLAARADAWSTSKERCLLASVFTGR